MTLGQATLQFLEDHQTLSVIRKDYPDDAVCFVLVADEVVPSLDSKRFSWLQIIRICEKGGMSEDNEYDDLVAIRAGFSK